MLPKIEHCSVAESVNRIPGFSEEIRWHCVAKFYFRCHIQLLFSVEICHCVLPQDDSMLVVGSLRIGWVCTKNRLVSRMLSWNEWDRSQWWFAWSNWKQKSASVSKNQRSPMPWTQYGEQALRYSRTALIKIRYFSGSPSKERKISSGLD